MKVKIGNFVNRCTSEIYSNHMTDRYGYDWPDNNIFENCLETTEDVLQWVYNHSINLYLDTRKRKTEIKIDPWDTWSIDTTLSYIIVPMLKQLKETTNGAPFVDFKDVPTDLNPTRLTKEQKAFGEIDETYFERWNYCLDEMIWAFEQKISDNWESQYYRYEEDADNELGLKLVWQDEEGYDNHQNRMTNGFRLFGKYYESLWD